MKILIIEDDQSVAELERDYLEINGGFDCDLYDNGNQGLQAALSQDYALVGHRGRDAAGAERL